MINCCGGRGVAIWDYDKSRWLCSDCGSIASNDPNYIGSKYGTVPAGPLPTPIKYYPSTKQCECGGDTAKTTHARYCPKYGG